MAKVSIIVPVYGVERYIEEALIALFSQTIAADIEYILVNDCTKDNSITIAERIIAEFNHLNVIIIHHKINKGSAAARQTGLEYANGKYIIFIDSDDWCELTMIEELYSKSQESNADIVVCNWNKVYKKRKDPSYNIVAESGIECVKLIMTGRMNGSLWIKLIRRDLIVDNNIGFIDGINSNEDIIFSIKAMCYASKVDYVPKHLYNYRYNAASMSTNPNQKTLDDIINATDHIEEFFKERGFLSQLEEYMVYRKLYTKLILLTITKGSNLQRNYISIYPEIKTHSNNFTNPIIRFALKSANYGHIWLFNLIISLRNIYFRLKN